jgi:hypothetical protein
VAVQQALLANGSVDVSPTTREHAIMEEMTFSSVHIFINPILMAKILFNNK